MFSVVQVEDSAEGAGVSAAETVEDNTRSAAGATAEENDVFFMVKPA